MNGFDEYMGDIFKLNDVIQFNSSPVAEVEAPDIETNIRRNIGKTSRQENSLAQNEMGPDETFLDLEGGRCNVVLKKSEN